MTKKALKDRAPDMWRYFELLPVADKSAVVSLGEGCTPLIRMPALEKRLGIRALHVKREEQNPTGSFKARGFSAAVSIMKEHGIRTAAVPSNGNAASAFAAYAARAGIKAMVIVPQDCPGIIIEECLRYGAATFQVSGMIHDAGGIIEEGKQEQGWYNAGTLREPGRAEGKKTMGLELAEQSGWRLPDVIIYPTGGGSGIIGLWKAFSELRAMGLAAGPLPRLVSVQEKGCEPIVSAMNGEAAAALDDQPVSSNPTGLRVPAPPDVGLIIRILRETNGAAVAVSKEEIADAQALMGLHGISSSPEGAATLAGAIRLRETGLLAKDESVVLFNTAHADKYLSWRPAKPLPIIRRYADMKPWLA